MHDLDRANQKYELAQDNMSLLPSYYRWIYSTIRSHVRGRVLELGAGAGHLIPSYVDSADEIVAVDNNPLLLSRLERNFGHDGVTAVNADLRDAFDSAYESAFDTVIALDIVEHFDDDHALMIKMSQALAKRGKLIVKVPADKRLYGETDKASGHFRRYDKDNLEKLVYDCGLECVELYEINKLGHLAYRQRKDQDSNFSRTFNSLTLKLINSFIPLARFADHLLPTRGLSLICVCRRN